MLPRMVMPMPNMATNSFVIPLSSAPMGASEVSLASPFRIAKQKRRPFAWISLSRLTPGSAVFRQGRGR